MNPKHHAALAHHFDSLGQQHDAQTLGMWVFLVTEVMIFGAILAAYAVYRASYPDEFERASQHLKVGLGGGKVHGPAERLALLGMRRGEGSHTQSSLNRLRKASTNLFAGRTVLR